MPKHNEIRTDYHLWQKILKLKMFHVKQFRLKNNDEIKMYHVKHFNKAFVLNCFKGIIQKET